MKAIAFLLKVPEDEGVDLILLDYEMPIADGPQVLQMLRQEPATAKYYKVMVQTLKMPGA